MTDLDTFDSDESKKRQQIESIIRAAGQYVQPSEDLRPRTMEAARQQCGDDRAGRRFGNFVIAMMFLVMVGSPIVALVKFTRSYSTSVSATEMERKALIYAAQPGIGTNWGLTEAFTQMRDVQADQLRRKTRRLK